MHLRENQFKILGTDAFLKVHGYKKISFEFENLKVWPHLSLDPYYTHLYSMNLELKKNTRKSENNTLPMGQEVNPVTYMPGG